MTRSDGHTEMWDLYQEQKWQGRITLPHGSREGGQDRKGPHEDDLGQSVIFILGQHNGTIKINGRWWMDGKESVNIVGLLLQPPLQ